MFHVVRRHAGPTNEYDVTRLHYWSCVSSKQTFLELACCSLSLLDQIWDAQNASYMDFQRVLGTALDSLLETLR